MTIRALLALAAPTTFWMLFGAEQAQAQPTGGPFAEIRCNRLASDPKMASTRPEPLNELLVEAERDGCDAVARRIRAQLTRVSGGPAEAPARPAQPDCTMATTLADFALATNDRAQIRTARDRVRGCASDVRRLNEWLEAHPGQDGAGPLRPLAPWEEYTEPLLDQREGDTRYDEFRIRLQQNEGVAIKMRSDAFAPLLAIGTGRMPDFNQMDYEVASVGEEAVLRFSAPLEGVQDYVVVAAHDGGAANAVYGPYVITRESWTPPPPPPPTPIAAGAPIPGRITDDTPSDGRLVYDTYSYQGRAGERLRISMQAEEFDPYLIFGRTVDGAFNSMANDDDGGDGLNALLRMVVLPEDGEYLIRARSLGGGPGQYTLQVESLAARSTERVSFDDANAWTARGLLLEDSPADENGVWFQEYTIRPARAGALSVRAMSTEFSPSVDIYEQTRDGLTPVDVYGEESARNRNEATIAVERRKTYLIRVRTSDVGWGGEFDLVVSEQPGR